MHHAVTPDPVVRAFLDVDPDGLDQSTAGGRNVADRGLERLLIAGARLAIAADLADELAGGSLQLTGRRRFTRTTEGLDAPAHAVTVGRMAVLRQPARLLLAVVVGLCLALVIDIARVGGPGVWLARHRALPAFVGQGRPVDIGGRSIYLDCRGTGAPTIVLEAGMGDGVAGWAPVHDAMAAFTRTCAYDRPGRGSSDPRGRHTVADAADELRGLLQIAGEPPPFIVVGHSLGEAYTRIFAARHRADVAGLVLVDGFSPDLQDDWIHPLLGPFRGEYEQQAQYLRDLVASVEDLDWPASEAQLRAADVSGIPIVVLRAPRAEPRLDEPTNVAIAAAWREAYGTLAPGRVRYEIAWGAGHIIQADRPDAVIKAARELVEAARATH